MLQTVQQPTFWGCDDGHVATRALKGQVTKPAGEAPALMLQANRAPILRALPRVSLFVVTLGGCGTEGEIGESESAASIEGNNLVLQIDAAIYASALIETSGPDLEPVRVEVAHEGDAPLFVPLSIAEGPERTFSIRLYESPGRLTHTGSLTVEVGPQDTTEATTTLQGRSGPGPLVRIGSTRVEVVAEYDAEGALILRADAFDPEGKPSTRFADARREWSLLSGRGYFDPPDPGDVARFFPLAPFGRDIYHQACLSQFAGGREYRYCNKTFMPPAPPSPVIDISVGENYCALKADGATYCWGQNPFEREEHNLSSIQLLPGGQIFTSLDGGTNTCGMTANGSTYCFGRQVLGDGTPWGSFNPRLVNAPSFIFVDAGGEYSPVTCGVTAAHDLYCWGSNVAGQVGNGTVLGDLNGFVTNPSLVTGGLKVDSVAAGKYHNCALETGTKMLHCWGSGPNGELGYPSSGVTTSPLATGLGPYEEVVASRRVTCVRAMDGKASCFGSNLLSGLGAGEPGCADYRRRRHFHVEVEASALVLVTG